MLRLIVLSVCIGVALCKNAAPPPPKSATPAAASAAAPAAAPAPAAASTPTSVPCGYYSSVLQVLDCLGKPHIIKQDVAKKCDRSTTDCDKMKCIFKKSGWMKDNTIDKVAFTAYLRQFAHDNPDWTEATAYIKEQCVDKPLAPQGIYLDCPVYDVIHCALTGFIRKANPSQWPSTPQCEQGKLFAASCPICPDSCYAPAIPIGSCNACLDWPKKTGQPAKLP